MNHSAGLGELLRYITELVDQGAGRLYREMDIDYRPRFTPVLRAMVAGAKTVTEITSCSFLTQGAISQTIAMMEKDGLLMKRVQKDGRKSTLLLTPKGKELVAVLNAHWESIFQAIRQLEQETGHPLMTVLGDIARALEIQGFDERIRQAGTRGNRNERNHP
ncbi:winged helix DNA-binding protein [Escherichia coli]